MQIEIVNSAIEARLRKQLHVTRASSMEEVLQHLLETQEAQDEWLLMNSAAVDVKIRRGIEQLDRGEGIQEDELDSYLAKGKAQGE